MSPAELHIWAVQDSARLNVIATTIRAALSSLDTLKIRALASVLAEAIEDDAKLDVANLVTKTLMELDPSHIRVLRAMCTEESPPSEEPVVPGGWKHSSLLKRFPQLGDGVLSIAVTLTSLAVLDEGLSGSRPDGEPDRAWTVTDYGKLVYNYLRDSATLDQGGSTNTG